MVWENNVYVIVMTTGTVEKGRAKCAEYWPMAAGEVVTHGEITVACTELEERSGFLRSVHTVTNGEGGETRPLEHYWYNTWPDHGVPTENNEIYCDNVLNMLTEVNESVAERAPNKESPIIVHCSAGVGKKAMDPVGMRTGTPRMAPLRHPPHNHHNQPGCVAVERNGTSLHSTPFQSRHPPRVCASACVQHADVGCKWR